MQLMTKAIEKKLPALYATENTEEKVAIVKYFGGGRGTWYAVEGDKQPDGDWLFFGYVKSPLGSDCDEWGYFTLSQLKSVKFPPFGLGIERDMHFNPTPVQNFIGE